MKRLLLLLALVAGCPIPPPVPPPGSATCGDVCKRLAELECPAAKPTPNGVSCTAVCENVQASNLIRWNLDCMAAALTCETADRCSDKQ